MNLPLKNWRPIASLFVCMACLVWSASAEPILAQENAAPILLNAGGPALTDVNGQDWDEDAHFGRSVVYPDDASSPNGVQTVFANTVYGSLRYARGPLTYAVPVLPGRYDIELHFAELWWGSDGIGNRVFTIEVEGRAGAQQFDILSASNGDFNVPLVVTVPGIDPALSGDPRTLDFSIVPVRDTAMLSGIVLSCAAGATCAEPPLTPETASFEVRQFQLRSTDLNDNLRRSEREPLAVARYDTLYLSDDPARLDAPYPALAMFPLAAQQGHTSTDGINDAIMLHASGRFTAAADGRYRFRTFNDDGVWVLVNGTPVISDPTFHGPQYFEGAIDLSAGVHDITVVYMEADRRAIIALEAEQPDGTYALLEAGQTLQPVAEGATEAVAENVGHFRTEYTVTVPSGFVAQQRRIAASFTSDGETAILQISAPGIAQCSAVFTSAARFEDMVLQAHSCGDRGGNFVIRGLEDDTLTVTGQIRNDIWTRGDLTFQMARQRIAIDQSETVRPDIPLDFVGVPFGPGVEDIKTVVADIYTQLDPDNDFKPLDPATSTIRPGWRGRLTRGVLHETMSATRDPATGRDFLTIISWPTDGEARLIGYSRVAFPSESRRATAEVLQKALVDRYGSPSGQWATGSQFGGLYWSFDTAGRKLRGSDAQRCLLWDQDSYRVPEWEGFTIPRGAIIPGVDMPPRSGCGVQVSVRHPVFSDPNGTPGWIMFSVFDASPRIAGEWENLIGLARNEAQAVRETADRAQKELQNRQAITPDL